MPDIEATLAERGSRYADFRDNAVVAQDIKRVFRSGPNWDKLPPYMQEGFDMFASKISRIMTGDLLYDDNIHDIIGYAKLMQDRMAQDRMDLSHFVGKPEVMELEVKLDSDFLFERVKELGFCDSLGFALALLGDAGFRVNDDGTMVNDHGETPDVVYLQHFHKNEPPVVDGSKVPNPSFFRDPLREVMARNPQPAPAPAPEVAHVDGQLREEMWDDHKGQVAWAYTDDATVANELDEFDANSEMSMTKLEWLQENVLAGKIDLYNMRQPDTVGVYGLGAFEIPKN